MNPSDITLIEASLTEIAQAKNRLTILNKNFEPTEYGCIIFRQIHYRLWGICLFDPQESLEKTKQWKALYSEYFVFGDVASENFWQMLDL